MGGACGAICGRTDDQAALEAAPAEQANDTDASALDQQDPPQAFHVPSGGGTSNEGRLVLTSTEDAAKHVDFNDLVTAGCAIPDTARRGISLDQLERIMVHVRRRLVDEREVWMVWNPQEQKKTRQLTSPDDVTLHDLNDYCIRAATIDQKTSLVERLAREEQTPDYFVSQ